MRGRHFERRTGVSTVEAAIVLPVLTLLTLGIIELGWYLHLAQVVHNAARQGARAAVRQDNSNAQVQAIVNNCLTANAGINSSAVTVTIARLSLSGQVQYQVQNLDENENGAPIRVAVSVDYGQMGLLTNILGLTGGNLSTFAVMQREK